jgi:tetratricopeptide (TPR) repeat protein
MAGQGTEPDRSGAAVDVAQCRANVAAGNLPHAAFHLGRALAQDPAFQPAYAALAEIAAAAGSSPTARELFKGDGSSVSAGNAAAVTALLADEGRAGDAVSLLGGVVAAAPDMPWGAAPWFGPGLAGLVPGKSVGVAVARIWKVIGDPARPETRAPLAPWLALCRAAAARPGTDPDVLCTMSSLARRLGAAEEAVAWCRAAEQRQRQAGKVTPQPVIMLGYAHKSAGQPADAAQAWKRALALDPGNLPLHLDLADLCFGQGDFPQARHWAEQAVKLDRSAVKARAAARAARYRESLQPDGTGDLAPLIELADLARDHPDTPYLRTLTSSACQGQPWLQIVPAPTEAIAQAAAEHTDPESQVVSRRTYLSALEAPSAVAAYRTRFPGAAIEAGEIREPDIRVPVTTDFGTPLWSYNGTMAVATAAPPSAGAVAILHRAASVIWGDPLVAYEQTAGFGELEAADLLGLLAHVPAPAGPGEAFASVSPLYWERVAQAWVCVGILHHHQDEPWSRSARRTLLLRLLFGAEDWTVDAAAFALCVSAWQHPPQRPEIAGAITQRYQHAAKAFGKRPTELHDPLARVLLICPGVDKKTASQARARLAGRAQAAPDIETEKERFLRHWKRRKS